ncbi:MAG: hprA [Clostridiales bacterium]|jgi:glycerate dehydrogenase|nr:hprA [Clostridiales bacterium]
MKIVVLDGYTLNPGDLTWKRLEEIGEVTVYDRTSPEEVLSRIGEAEIVFTNKTVLSRETFKQAKNIKYVGVLATGYNVVDVEAAKERNIVVTNIPTYGTNAVSQFTFALLLEMCHHVWAHNEEVKRGAWTNCPDFCFWNYPLIELSGKTMGIIGFGRIGQAVADIAVAFGMKVLAYDTYKNVALESHSIKYAELDDIYRNADVISLHVPLFENTKGMINRDSISKMKKSAMIINTSRGPLINEQDLAQALNSGAIAGAAVDVVSTEPAKMDNSLLSAKNCIVTPHIAWAPIEARERLMNIAIDNLEAFLTGKVENQVK